ncbi:MAG: DAK2 domain-containing protein [Lachnospiraceae bacterium]|nr:DAK2 domain-containing protein [Lachnospiraceae bacterium]
MHITLIDAGLLKKCFIAGAKNLDANKEYINELNVFPVPDGDTGTNMSMTIMSAARAIDELEDPDMRSLVKAMSSGSLRGARGNSGVIMSQLIRGFCKAVDDNETIDAALAQAAFTRAVETAYKAVMKPKEGTILTVARGMSEKVEELAPEAEDLTALLGDTVSCGREVLANTPELLPVLKEAGVVDSGGQGLIVFMEGVLAVLEGREVDLSLGSPAGTHPGAADLDSLAARADAAMGRGKISTDDIKFGYCTEFIVNLPEPLPDEKVLQFKAFLESIGDSIVCVADDEMIKIHVHTNHPGQAFEKGLEMGSLSRMKVDNMREEHEEKLIRNASKIAAMEKLKTSEEEAKKKAPKKPVGFVTVCSGSGLKKIFEELGADYVIQGGQTMNPSTDDMLNAIEAVHAEDVFILPNNKNIILAAEQAAKICTDCRIHVIPTKTIPQGITALINYRDGAPAEENVQAMSESLSTVRSGEVTYAVRNTQVDGREIREGDIMGIGDRGILAVGEVLNDTTMEMLKEMVDDYTSIITVYSGEGIDDEAAGMLCDRIREAWPDTDVEYERGEQPVYYYIISAE